MARAAVSFLPDEPVLYDDLSVREHLAYIAALHGVTADAADFDELLERVGIAHRADDLPARFSRGLRQKASIALGLVRPFEILLVDEPFVGLDAPGKEALLDIFAELHQDGAAIVVATHDPAFVERVDRCVALRDGEVVHDGPATPADVLRLVGA
jgi:ABC-2 type transport system ATP-binding protein